MMQDAATKGQNLCHCLAVRRSPFLALHIPYLSNEEGAILVSHYDLDLSI
jgi:hypothetical protein